MFNSLRRLYNLFFLVFICCSAAAAQYNSSNLKPYLDRLEREDEIDLVLSMLKQDIPDYYPSEIAAALKKSYPPPPADNTIRVMPYVRSHLITSGKEMDRVKLVAGKLLKYMWLDDRIRIIYFDSEVPVVAFTYPNALVVSSAAESMLTDDELEAQTAHEIAHLIVQEHYKEAVESNNLKKRRVIELFCDAAAISILKAKGRDPKNLVTGLEKMQERLLQVNNAVDGGLEHPTIRVRRKLFNVLTEKFSTALAKAVKP